MRDTLKQLNVWLEKLESFSLPNWEALPDLDLYMDQVLTYLDRELSPLTVEDQEKMMTASMINNYVKGNVLPNPIQKKYAREHLGYMLAVCAVKQILSISDVTRLFHIDEVNQQDIPDFYAFFKSTQSKQVKDIAKNTQALIKPFGEDNTLSDKDISDFLEQYVLRLAIESEIKKIVANKILYLMKQNESTKKATIEKQQKAEEEKLEKLISATDKKSKKK